MYEIAFRCDASIFHKIGTGHLYRCLAIAENLSKKNNIKKNKIVFVCKKNSIFKKTKEIISRKNFKVLHFVKNNEISFLKKLNSKNIIFDRIKQERKELISMVKKKYDKVIFLESTNKNINGCLRINSLIHRKSIKFSGYKFLVTPLINQNRKKLILNKNKVFINLGGINKNLYLQIFERLKNIKKVKFCLPKETQIKKQNVELYNNSNFYKKLKESKVIICTGGLIFFDSLFLDKTTLVFAKDNHQKANIYNVNRLYKANIPLITNIKNLRSNFFKIYNKNNNLKIFNLKNMDQTLKLIYKYLYA